MAVTDMVQLELAAKCILGEGPVWDAQRGVVWFVDIKRHQLWHYDPENGSNSVVEAPDQIGWALPAEGGMLLCGLKDGLYIFEPETGTFSKLMNVPGEIVTNRLNDACTDRWGRVWFGSMDDSEATNSGRFYVYDRGEIRPTGPAGISITNGPAVNADSSLIYFTDTVAQKIMVADLTQDGVGDARPFVDVAAHFPGAYPDGPHVDAQGNVWTGLFLGSQAARFAPDGSLAGTTALPAQNITKLCLGGADLRTAYVTTARKGMDDNAIAAEPRNGALLSFRVDVPGFATALAKLG